jgi:Ring finger domain
MQPQDLILFALSKDERHIRHLDSLLQEIIPSGCPKGLSWLLFSVVFVRQHGKTLGMEFCGLTSKGNRLWKIMASSALLSIFIEIYLRKLAITNVSRSDELRGRARQRYYHRQRQAMLQRANQSNPIVTIPSSATIEPSEALDSHTAFSLRAYSRRLFEILKDTALKLSSLTLAEAGPHQVTSIWTNRTESLAKFIIRLFLAYFLIKGQFPISKLIGLRMEGNRPNILSSKNKLHRVAAFLLLQQASVTVVHYMSRELVRLWILCRKTFPRKQQHMESKRSEMDSQGFVCPICKNMKSHLSIPINCGHIFCWSCLYQWTSVTRPECPLCRAPCRPQEIMPLHNYKPFKK